MRTHRALLLSYYTPPRAGVATTRTRQLLRYLPQFGWEVTALTPRLDGAGENVIQTEYFDLAASVKRLVGIGDRSAHAALGTNPSLIHERRTLRQRAVELGFRFTTYPDAQVGWFAHGRNAVRELLASGQYDVVISTSPPFTSNLILASLKLNVPWIADFRDLWADGAYSGSAIRNMLDSALERWTLSKVTRVTTITEKMCDVIRSHRPGTQVDAIPNSLDPEEWDDIPFETEEPTTFVHAGQLFHGLRDPRTLFAAVRALIDRGEIAAQEVRIDLYGSDEPWLEPVIDEYGMRGIVRTLGKVSRERIMQVERRADRNVILLWDSPNTEGILTGKLFEYLGARRSILAIGGPQRSAIDGVLEETRGGIRCLDQRSLEREVLQAVIEHREARVRILDPELLHPYDAITMSQRFARVLDESLAAHAP